MKKVKIYKRQIRSTPLAVITTYLDHLMGYGNKIEAKTVLSFIPFLFLSTKSPIMSSPKGHIQSLFISIGFSPMISLDVNERNFPFSGECKTQSIRSANKLLASFLSFSYFCQIIFSPFRKINIYAEIVVIERQPSCKLERKTNGLLLS